MSHSVIDMQGDYYEASKKLKVPQKEQDNLLIRMINKRMSENMDTRIICEGEGGIGKSWLSLRLAELVDPMFRDNPASAIKRQVFFKATEFLRGVTTLDPLSVLLYDEPAQSWHHREFMSEVNIVLSKTMIGYRYKRFITILNVPNLDMIDKDARALCQFLINVHKRGHAEVYKISINKFGGGIWYRKLIDNMTLKAPDTKLVHAYEALKKKQEDELFKEYFRQASEKDKPKLTNSDIIGMIKSKPETYNKNDKLYSPAIMAVHGVGRHRADSIIAKIEIDEAEKERQS